MPHSIRAEVAAQVLRDPPVRVFEKNIDARIPQSQFASPYFSVGLVESALVGADCGARFACRSCCGCCLGCRWCRFRGHFRLRFVCGGGVLIFHVRSHRKSMEKEIETPTHFPS